MRKAIFLFALSAMGSAALAQQSTDPGQARMDAMLKGVMQNVLKLNGTCKLLSTPNGDLTKDCDPELINMAFPSGNSSFIVTIKDKGSISFRGKDSKAVGDMATLKVDTILLTGSEPVPITQIAAKGKCTYTNPNVGPVHVECNATSDKGVYQLSYVSDGVWPPR